MQKDVSQAYIRFINFHFIKCYFLILTANVPRDSNSPNEKSPKTSLILMLSLKERKM